jgi:hypothetical protein
MPRTSKGTTKTSRTVSRTASMTKDQTMQLLSQVAPDRVFWVNDGSILRDMRELRDALLTMSDQTFAYHCNEVKKDFSNWVRDIIGDETLARDLEKATNREQAAGVVAERYDLLVSKSV